MMNTYLAIITTVLVITQVIRVVQNNISLKRQEEELKRNIDWINERELGKSDFDRQKLVFELAEIVLADEVYKRKLLKEEK